MIARAYRKSDGTEILPGDVVLDFRGDPVVFHAVTRLADGRRSAKIQLFSEHGSEVYASVVPDLEVRALQAGQAYDPGYFAPDLPVGLIISGRTVIAAVRQTDCPGLLPGLHIVTAYDPDPRQAQAFVTWQVGWQEGYGWAASAGNYTSDRGRALYDMAVRAGIVPDEREQLAGGLLVGYGLLE